MKSKIGIWMIGCICMTACTQTPEKLKVHIIGDSTMADYVENTTRTRGWGEMLQEFFIEEAEVVNYARGGRSSRSFCEEGRWDKVKENMSSGDYVLIQFAHNDEKEGGKDGEDGRGTAPWTTYKSYLEKYVDETRELGGIPVFVTPIIRRYFMEDGTISPKGCHDLGIAPDDSTLNYVRVMKHVARNKGVQLVDMTASTKAFAEALGAEQTIKCIYVPTDGTHTQATGAAYYARLAVDGLREQGILKEYIMDNTSLVLNPTSLDFQTLYVGDEVGICFDLTGLDLLPTEGNLMIEAPQGMMISDDPHGEKKQSLTYSYKDSKLWNHSFYLYFKPETAGMVDTAVCISYGETKRMLPVVAEVKNVSRQTKVSIPIEHYTLKELQETPQGITTVAGTWPAEIDEAQKRYVEIVLPRREKTLVVRSVSFEMEGDACYRLAYAWGKDFYPRTDIGEEQQANRGIRKLSYPINTTLQVGEQMHIRLFPWSTEKNNMTFKVGSWSIDGVEIE